MTDARTEILARLRSALAGVESETPLPPVSTETDRDQSVATFVERARAAGAQVYDVPPGGDYETVVGEILASLDADKIAVSSDPVARQACMNYGAAAVSGEVDREALFGCVAGVTRVQAAVAETGSLVLRTDVERHRLTSLVPDVHVALVERSDVVATLDDVFAGLAKELGEGADLPRCVTFITGPSRTADIELELVVGVHGPKELHIVLFG